MEDCIGMEDEVKAGEFCDSMGESPRCYCGYKAQLKISWSKKNPGRRFFGCPQWTKEKKTSNHCNYFKWYDQESCKRSNEVMPDLKVLINGLHLEIERKNFEINRADEKIKELKKNIEMLQLECAKQVEDVGELKEVIAELRRKDQMCSGSVKVMLFGILFVLIVGQMYLNDSVE